MGSMFRFLIDSENGETVKQEDFKYLGSTVQNTGDGGEEVKQCGMGEIKVKCRQRLSARMNALSKRWLDQQSWFRVRGTATKT